MTRDQVVGTYVHIPGKPREQHALYMLRRIASLVKPIMSKGGYKVGCLAEFYPGQRDLLGVFSFLAREVERWIADYEMVGLNVNSGEKVCIRLRQPYDESVFLNIDDCVFTMLHEITHNLHGPHNDTFYTHLKTLEESYSALRHSGYDGEGFYSEGKRLGAGIPKNPQLSEARLRALAAAEKRRDMYSGCSGQRLGSGCGSSSRDPLPGGLGIREKIAAATERRIRDSQTCGAGSGAGDRGAMEAEAERTIRAGTVTVHEQEVILLDDEEVEDPENEAAIIKAAIELIEEAEREEAEQALLWEERGGIVWIVDDEDGPIQVELPPTHVSPPSQPPPSARISPPAPITIPSSPPLPPAVEQDLPPTYEQATTWTCDLCTLINPAILPRCEACSFERPDDIAITSPPQTPLSPIYQSPPLTQAVIAGKERERERQKVRFVDMPSMIPEKRGETVASGGWRCGRCGTRNSNAKGLWTGCGGCGLRGEV
ncbi:WLM-domain-containing protein [Choiromyces venosus 120613-1]|uniref:WLM-domain-containing protein n=1 Tax=Choiromyces venosus 120613-1 TaxID=1336337 RepID=A0A3N4JVI4_9PEZI|nr:WLM-domain-containing protein [Choiromyces venosus 120613-1]